MAIDGLTAAAEALYALVPEEFTAARNARAADAKTSDRALAGRIASLKRPSPAAWVVNRLAREHGDEVGDLVGLGGELADAQSSGDGRALTTLVAERRRAVAGLLRSASALAEAADRGLSRAVLDEVEQTLVAATVSAEAGAAVRSGRLVRALQAVGSEVDVSGAVAGELPEDSDARSRARRGAAAGATAGGGERRADATAAASERDDVAAQQRAEAASAAARARAEAEVAAAREAAQAAERGLAEADTAVAAADERVAALRAERDELEERLDRLRDELTDAEREARAATRARESAAHAADRAGADLEAAEATAARAR
ncbi:MULTISPECIES: transposase [unclassified Agromyces]|uniref:transposase n=1 Tax=unclassified Agromyces TaxID=2639701 RepID=UPI0030145C8E